MKKIYYSLVLLTFFPAIAKAASLRDTSMDLTRDILLIALLILGVSTIVLVVAYHRKRNMLDAAIQRKPDAWPSNIKKLHRVWSILITLIAITLIALLIVALIPRFQGTVSL